MRNTARVRRHGGHDDIPTSCSSANDEFECELVIMDRDIAENPLRVAKIEAYKPFEYSKYSLKYLLYQIPSQVWHYEKSAILDCCQVVIKHRKALTHNVVAWFLLT